MPPKFPWKTAVVILVALIVIGVILVTMWPGLRKPHAIKRESSVQRETGAQAALRVVCFDSDRTGSDRRSVLAS